MLRRAMLTAAVLLAAAACEEQEIETTQQMADRPECPHTWDWSDLKNRGGEGLAVPSGQLSVPAEIQNVPEFHDCQRFLVADEASGELRYDALFAIFASANLEKLGRMPPDEAWAAAEIYAENDYPPLHIRTGFNCLFLYQRGVGGEWRAKMSSVGFDEPNCGERVDVESLAAPQLQVKPRPPDQYKPPPVARWDWDATNHKHYIGISCGTTYCEVGPNGFQPSPDHRDLAAAVGSQGSHVFEIKGWYDEQRLATLSLTGGLPTATQLVGTLIPDAELADQDMADFDGEWVAAAQVALSARESLSATDQTALDAYKKKFNFDPTRPEDPTSSRPLNQIYLCMSLNNTCKGTTELEAEPCKDNEGPGVWWAKIVAAGDGSEIYRCVTRRSAPDNVTVPATARWRWLADDEGGWMRCLNGCCEVQ